MTVKVGINGFGRIGRLALRASWGRDDFEIVYVNEVAGDAALAAHLLKHDSVHGPWERNPVADENGFEVDGRHVGYSRHTAIGEVPWAEQGVEVVLDCTGHFKSKEALQPYFDSGVKKVIVSAPVKDGTLNIVMGVNDDLYDAAKHHVVTAASCTTNCIAPVVDVIHKNLVIRHGSITTIHDITNTQSILDEYHKDWRRARASGMSLIPTTTGSATAITEIFPELKGRLNGIAVRVPLANASLTDCVFEVEKAVTAEVVNSLLKEAAEGHLQGILGYEEKPLVSVDYTNDTRSGVIDALSTMVVNGTQVKLLVWYDNEIGYVHRMVELTAKIVESI
jgi:glyceraldehyde 3-phosphate dehydrogenase